VLAFVGLAPTKLGEKFLNYHLERKLAAVKHDHDSQILELKELLTRASRVHERQVDTLTKLHRHFSDARKYFEAMARTGSFGGEVHADEYGRLCQEAVTSARDTLGDGYLLIPPDLAQQWDRFFDSLFKGQRDLLRAKRPRLSTECHGG
jgi:hypothetical protein